MYIKEIGQKSLISKEEMESDYRDMMYLAYNMFSKLGCDYQGKWNWDGNVWKVSMYDDSNKLLGRVYLRKTYVGVEIDAKRDISAIEHIPHGYRKCDKRYSFLNNKEMADLEPLIEWLKAY